MRDRGNGGGYQELVAAAWDYYEEDRLEECRAAAEQAIALDPKPPEAHYVKGVALEGLGDRRAARAAFRAALDRDPRYYQALIAEARLIADAGPEVEADPETGLALCDRAVALIPPEDAPAAAEAHSVRADLLVGLDGLEDALRACDAAVAADRNYGHAHVQRGFVLYLLGRFPEAKEALRRGVGLLPQEGYAHHLLAKVHLRLEEDQAAGREFRTAADLDPEEYPVPFRIGREEFDRIARRALAGIPGRFRSRLGNVGISVMDFPPVEEVRAGLDPDVLGVYQGRTTFQEDALAFPDRIVLYQRNLENICGSREELEEEIALTIRHEVGHHLGLDEEELRRIEEGGW